MPGHSNLSSDHSAGHHGGHSFRKKERLTGRTLISTLFREGRNIQTSAFTIYFRECEGGETPARVAVSVPRRLFRRAVDRNLLKRRIREAYRLNKPVFYEMLQKTGIQVCLVIIYRKREISDFFSIRSALPEALQLLVRALEGPGTRHSDT